MEVEATKEGCLWHCVWHLDYTGKIPEEYTCQVLRPSMFPVHGLVILLALPQQNMPLNGGYTAPHDFVQHWQSKWIYQPGEGNRTTAQEKGQEFQSP